MVNTDSLEGIIRLAKCACGCGQYVRAPGRRFLLGHHLRVSGPEHPTWKGPLTSYTRALEEVHDRFRNP